tara:strand:- start:40 stop:333 length:294 start_codon:yes stop_codon:yes gene_type:complete
LNPNIVYVGILKYLPVEKLIFTLPLLSSLIEVAKRGEILLLKLDFDEKLSLSLRIPKEKLILSLKIELEVLKKKPYFKKFIDELYLKLFLTFNVLLV